MALALVLFFYAANSEVVWLYLLAYWVAAVVAASLLYAAWNRGFNLSIKVVGILHRKDFVAEGLGDEDARESAFEFDRLRVGVKIDSRGGGRGPAGAHGTIGKESLAVASGVVSKSGFVEERLLQPQRRGVVRVADWWVESGDPLGLFAVRARGRDGELTLVLPRYTSLRRHPLARELEASVTAPRAGSGTEVFGVRQYQPGDPLRRIHWRSTARLGELIVREFEPPGVQNVGIFLDPSPTTPDGADQCARLAASEAWDCIRAGGRVTLWAPGCEPTRPEEERSLHAILQWLARYPRPSKDAPESPPPVGAAVAVTTQSEPRLLDAIEDVSARGGPVRAWVVGAAVLATDVETERIGMGWPPS